MTFTLVLKVNLLQRIFFASKHLVDYLLSSDARIDSENGPLLAADLNIS